MNFTKCLGKPLAIEYNEKYDNNAKNCCYYHYCCLTEVREPTPYKIIQTEDGYREIFDKTFYKTKDKKYEEIPISNNPLDPWSEQHRKTNEVLFYAIDEDDE